MTDATGPEVSRVIPHHVVRKQIERIERALRDADIDPDGLELSGLGGEIARQELVRQIEDAGAHVARSSWGWAGADVEVRLVLRSEGDLIFFRTIISDHWS